MQRVPILRSMSFVDVSVMQIILLLQAIWHLASGTELSNGFSNGFKVIGLYSLQL